MAPRTISDFIHSLPKTEIHIHAEATVSFDSYFALNRKYGMDPSLKGPADFRKLLAMDSLGAMIKNFLYLQTLFRAPEDFALVVPDVEAYARRNNVRYMETFVAPSMVLKQGGIDFKGILDPLVEGFDRLASSGGPDVRLIVDVSRTFGPENAKRNVDHVLRYLGNRSTDRVIGIGLGGSEAGNPCAPYKAVFAAAREAGLRVVAHAGEEVGPESIRDAVAELGAERIGHGTSAVQDPALMDLLAERAIPLEVCPASNVITGKYVRRYEEHPLRAFFDRGMLVTLNTDDPVLFEVELDEEFRRVAEKLAFDRAGIVKLLENGIRATFMDEAGKKAARERLAAAAKALA
ncbi:MAG TPA: adenosine deaminase [Spirochaetia bacterium]|nr:adenosine deaminase [Spirochaetia bacterium]HRZ66336.1 adenosine deaminase [Spirochaetia bacterium]